jgi:hypothetical protein
MTEDEKIARADQARQLLAHPLLKEAFEALEREKIKELKAMPIWAGLRKRVCATEALKTVDYVRTHLEAQLLIATGAEKRKRNALRAVS